MRLATIRTAAGHQAVRAEGGTVVPLDAADVGSLLARPGWEKVAADAAGTPIPAAGVDFAPVIPRPPKIFCVGLNYRQHIQEMGRELPRYPTLFAKFARCLIGPADDLVLPAVSQSADWEAELGVIIGRPARRASPGEALGAIAGYTVVNDVSMRDYQRRTTQWLQGKAFEASTPAGPWLVTPEEVGHAADLELRCLVDGEVMQSARTSDLVHGPAEIVSYISQFITLEPGDLIATGTPGGVGAARDPQLFLAPGQVLTTAIEGIGECRNLCREER